MRLNRAVAVLLLAIGASGLTAVPAQADEPALSFSTLDTNQAGHVKGTIATEAAFVYARLSSAVPATVFAVVDGQAVFDLETWGYFNPSNPNQHVQAVACTGGSLQAPTGCGSEPILSAAFVPNDLAPVVTWPTDTTIGHTSEGASQEVSVTVSDPAGGGVLKVAWHYSDPEVGDGTQVFDVSHGETITPDLHDGVGVLRISRCSSANSYICTYYAAQDSPTITVARTSKPAQVTSSTPITSTAPASTVTVSTNHSGHYRMSWHVLQYGSYISGVGGSTEGTLDDNGTFHFTIPGAGLPSGSELRLAGQITIDDPEFGVYTLHIAPAPLTVDRDGPAIEGITASRTTFYPRAIDALAAYRTTKISITDSEQLDYHDQLVVRDGAGRTVRHLETTFASGVLGTATWDGRNDAGAVVRPDAYQLVVIDPLGNPSPVSRWVVVLSHTGVLRTYRRTVSAAGSAIDRYAGRCSTLRRPALRGWSGSFGYYSNTRCRRSDRASTVSTLNTIRLPNTNALRYVDARVDTNGGAARRAPGSRGLIRLWVGDRWTAYSHLSRSLGTHTGPRRSGTVDRDRYVVWNFAAARGNRYDVKSFTVTVRYYSWT